MNKISLALLSLLMLAFYACSSNVEEDTARNVSVDVVQRLSLKIPSGSGITGYKNGYLTVGDDSPWLYYLDSNAVLIDSLRLSNVAGYEPGVRMSKEFKPDFESITRLNDDIVLVMGSGSYTDARDTAYLVNGIDKMVLAKKSMGPVFQQMAERAHVEYRHSLNIEGAAVAEHNIYFFNRSDLSGKSLIFKADLANFIAYFTSGDSLAITEIYSPVPRHEEHGMSTFSGAFYLPGGRAFLFSSTKELGSHLDSTAGVVDGEIHGSFLGRLSLDELNDPFIPVEPIMENGELAKIKVEGIWLHKVVSDSTFQFIAVSDPDNGTTNTFLIEVKLNRFQ